MTHPAWPSNHWQIYSADYDTQASYYGAKTATEPLHAQMNLPDHALAVVNTSLAPRDGLTLTSRILSLGGELLAERRDAVSAPANQVTTLAPLDLAPHLAKAGVVLVVLELRDRAGALVSQNLYWQGRDEASLKAMDDMAPQPLRLVAKAHREGDEMVAEVDLEDTGIAPALQAKLTLVDDHGERILPAYYSDNYIWLLPGAPKRVEIRYPAAAGRGAHLNLRGWNVSPAPGVAISGP
jgi:hypothetical protein